MRFLPAKSFFNRIIFLERVYFLLTLFEIVLLIGIALLLYFDYFFFSLFLILLLFWTELFKSFIKFSQNLKPKYPLEDFISNPAEFNAFDFFDYHTFKILKSAIRKTQKLRLKEIPFPLIAFYLLQGLPKSFKRFVFFRGLIDPRKYYKDLKSYVAGLKKENNSSLDFGRLEELVLKAGQIALKRNHPSITIEDFFSAFVYYAPFLKHYLVLQGLKPDDINRIIEWYLRIQNRIEKRRDFLSYENLSRLGSIGKNWATGFTPTLDLFSVDWTETVRRVDLEDFPGHQEELKQVERILSKREANNDVLLVGKPGTFRRNIIRKLALKLDLGLSAKELNYYRLVELKLGSLIAQQESRERVETILSRIFQEVIGAGNIILVIDNFHNYFLSEERLGAVDISNILIQFLRRRDFRLIGITTYKNYYQVFDKRKDLLSYFEKVEVDEFNEEETLEILENKALILEHEYKKFIPYKTIKDLIYYSEKYLPDIPLPKKALDLLEEVVVYVFQNTPSSIVSSEHVALIVQQKTEIPVGKIEKEEREKLLSLENLIHQQIINQEEAVREIAESLRRARADISIRKGPMGAFLFLGPTGVGKTETAKSLARIYFGGEERIIRIDMSEFQKKEDIARLIGSPRETGRLVTEVKNNPFSLVLLDEIEKAHPDVLNLFLQILDEGYCRDALGEKIHFEHTIIIATSNAGYKIILEAIKKGRDFDRIKLELLEYLFQNNIFRPEFVNRFDGVIIFKPLTRENLLDIAGLLLSKLQKNLRAKEITLLITPEIKARIVELGYNPVFGAREMRRVIQDKIENVLAEALLRAEINPGDTIKISPVNFQIIKVET